MSIAGLLIGAALLVLVALGGHGPSRSSGFASLGLLGPLRRRGRGAGGLPIGRLATARWWRLPVRLSAPVGESVLVIGPTGSDKTTSLIIPSLLSWEGPIVAASVKDDLLLATESWRRSKGRVGILAPGELVGPRSVTFEPVGSCGDFGDARRIAQGIVGLGPPGSGHAEMEFWGQLAIKLLAGLLLAANRAGGDLSMVAGWLDHHSTAEPLSWVSDPRDHRALDALEASFGRDERQLGSVIATAEAAIEPLLDQGGARSFDPTELLAGEGTLYLCAPAHDQRRFAQVFASVTSEVLRQAFLAARQQGGRLAAPLLVVLDEAAAIAPLGDLDVLAATCASHGITLVTCFQDLAQIQARWSERAATIVNNHRTRIFLGGLADPAAAEFVGALGGPAARARSEKVPSPLRRLIEPHQLRQMPRRSALVVSGSIPMTRAVIRPWWSDRVLRARGEQR